MCQVHTILSDQVRMIVDYTYVYTVRVVIEHARSPGSGFSSRGSGGGSSSYRNPRDRDRFDFT